MNAADNIKRNILKMLLENVEVFEHDLDLLDSSYREKYEPYVEMLKKIKQQTQENPKQLSDMPHEFEKLLRDFDSCQLPNPYDPLTEKTLSEIAINIHNKKYNIDSFNKFAETHLGNGYFADACKKYVSDFLKQVDE